MDEESKRRSRKGGKDPFFSLSHSRPCILLLSGHRSGGKGADNATCKLTAEQGWGGGPA